MPTPARNRLVLVPTPLEFGPITSELGQSCDGLNIQLCGFGPIVSAARTSALITRMRPEQVILVGIAGAYVDQLEIGEAYSFGQVGCYGVGVGSGEDFQTAGDVGWQHWQADADERIGNELTLTVFESARAKDGGLLLTVTSAAGSAADCENRLSHFPHAVAEDMEAFGVAAACKLSGVSLTVVRGISNWAGDREKENWQIKRAIHSAANLVKDIVTSWAVHDDNPN